MATGKPDSRETHVTRIFGTNKKGERLDDIWIDVERMDIVKSAMQVPPHLQWQGVQRKFRWADDPSANDYSPDGPPSRIVEIVKVCDPENTKNIDDPDEWVEIPVIRALRARAETGTEDNGGSAMERFLRSATADELQTARVVEVRKIAHCDTNVDDAIQAAADANPTLRQYVVPSNDYVKDAATRDKGQYVDHEIITYLKHKGNAGDVAGIARQTRLLNEYLIDASDPAEGKVTGTFGFNPPYRLDPYQNIVNVSWSRFVLVCFFPAGSSSSLSVKLSSDKAKILFDGPLSHDGFFFPPYACVVKVPANLGKFARVTIQGSIGDVSAGHGWPGQIIAATCPFDANDPDGSVDRAKKIFDDDPDSGFDAAGILFSAMTTTIPPGSMMDWKIVNAKYKTDNSKLVQCYPLNVTPNSVEFPISENLSSTYESLGFYVKSYRTDKKATGTVYKAPPEWSNNVIALLDGSPDGSEKGISFRDELPPVTRDVPF